MVAPRDVGSSAGSGHVLREEVLGVLEVDRVSDPHPVELICDGDLSVVAVGLRHRVPEQGPGRAEVARVVVRGDPGDPDHHRLIGDLGDLGAHRLVLAVEVTRIRRARRVEEVGPREDPPRDHHVLDPDFFSGEKDLDRQDVGRSGDHPRLFAHDVDDICRWRGVDDDVRAGVSAVVVSGRGLAAATHHERHQNRHYQR